MTLLTLSFSIDSAHPALPGILALLQADVLQTGPLTAASVVVAPTPEPAQAPTQALASTTAEPPKRGRGRPPKARPAEGNTSGQATGQAPEGVRPSTPAPATPSDAGRTTASGARPGNTNSPAVPTPQVAAPAAPAQPAPTLREVQLAGMAALKRAGEAPVRAAFAAVKATGLHDLAPANYGALLAALTALEASS